MAIQIANRNSQRYGPSRQQIQPQGSLLISSGSDPLLQLKIGIHSDVEIPASGQHPHHPTNLQHRHHETPQRTGTALSPHEKEKQIHRH